MEGHIAGMHRQLNDIKFGHSLLLLETTSVEL